jgi:cytoskeletal protein CcmA (bactofilin family)
MFSKPNTPAPPAPAPPRSDPAPALQEAPPRPAPDGKKLTSLIASDLVLEGSITGGGELQVDGSIKGDVRVERVTIGPHGHVEGGVFAEVVEVRGRVTGSITAKQVRLYGAAHVDGDISHEQLAMEIGAFFQGRSLRLQRAAPAPVAAIAPAPAPKPAPLLDITAKAAAAE